MKTAVANPTATARKKGRAFSVRRREGQGKANAPGSVAAGASTPLRYDAEDIEEANRIGAALCRQHAR